MLNLSIKVGFRGPLLAKNENHGKAVHIINSAGIAYHQDEVLYIIKSKENTR